MKKYLLILFLCASVIYAQGTTPYDTYLASKFLYRSHTYKNFTLPYRLFIPENYDSSKSYPLVLALHGSGERGTDNNTPVVYNRMAVVWADSNNQKKYPAIVVVPQCPVDSSWLSSELFDRLAELIPITTPLAAANDIINSLAEELNIDFTRLYITGLSMGGFGTWELISRYPDRFAAAIPMSGGGDIYATPNLIHMPIWNFHGTNDDAVPVEFSDNLVNRLASFGRETIFTHCNNQNCDVMDSASIAAEIKEGNDLIYTKYENGGHVVWRESYDHPLLVPWVFKQYHLQNRINITSPASYETLSGTTTITWESSDSESSADIYISLDKGEVWSPLAKSAPNNGVYELNTGNFPDAAFAVLKIILRDKDNIAYANTTSVPFGINNNGNGKPDVKIDDTQFAYARVESDSITLKFLAADPDEDSLSLQIYYSSSGRNNFELVSSSSIGSREDTQQVNINLRKLLNSNDAYFALTVNDGEFPAADTSYFFYKMSGRYPVPQDYVNYQNSNFDVPFTINIIDELKITGDEYRITFDDIFSSTDKYYSVYNLTKNLPEITNERIINGAESKMFGGYSFITENTQTHLNLQESGWSEGAPQINFTMTPFSVNNYPIYNGYAAPADYLVEFSDSNEYMSAGDTLMTPNRVIYPPKQVNFRVQNLSAGTYPDFVTYITGTLNKVHTIYMKEAGFGREGRTWRILIYASSERIGSEGDSLLLRTFKGLSVFDTIIVKSLPVYAESKEVIPSGFYLYQNYPNPFNPSTTIKYTVAADNMPEQQVSLVIYDILGREVRTLFNEIQKPGNYEVKFEAGSLASGVYIYRLQAGKYSQSRKMLFLK